MHINVNDGLASNNGTDVSPTLAPTSITIDFAGSSLQEKVESGHKEGI